MSKRERFCFVASCDLPAIGTKNYCPTHMRAARAWLREQAWLDAEDEKRRIAAARRGVDWTWGDAEWLYDA